MKDFEQAEISRTRREGDGLGFGESTMECRGGMSS